MTTNKPITIDGIEYPLINFSLAITTRHESGKYTAGAALRFSYGRETEDGGQQEAAAETAVSVVDGDTATSMQTDPAKAALISAIASAMRDYANSLGLDIQ